MGLYKTFLGKTTVETTAMSCANSAGCPYVFTIGSYRPEFPASFRSERKCCDQLSPDLPEKKFLPEASFFLFLWTRAVSTMKTKTVPTGWQSRRTEGAWDPEWQWKEEPPGQLSLLICKSYQKERDLSVLKPLCFFCLFVIAAHHLP